jgi:hypothetical protein
MWGSRMRRSSAWSSASSGGGAGVAIGLTGRHPPWPARQSLRPGPAATSRRFLGRGWRAQRHDGRIRGWQSPGGRGSRPGHPRRTGR